MKKRTKVSLRTKIYLTITAGVLALAGILYGSNPQQFSSAVPNPTGVAAAPDLLLITPFCGDGILSLGPTGAIVGAWLIPGFGSCREKYMTIAPSQAAMAGFTPRDAFVTQGPLVYKLHQGVVTLFADLSTFGCTSSDHNGIT